MTRLIIVLFVVFAAISGCREQPDCCNLFPNVSGAYIGQFAYTYQGKNPISGSFFHDTSYTDTFGVTLFAATDSIRFNHDSFEIQFKTNAAHFYQAGPYTIYRLTETDSLYYNSYFYSGTDADHFYSETFSFRGKK